MLLRNQTGNDFSGYKRNTIIRRINRRMTIQQIDYLADYIAFLQDNSKEVETLFKELLIGVTNFFRDPHAFEYLKSEVFPEMLLNKTPGIPSASGHRDAPPAKRPIRSAY